MSIPYGIYEADPTGEHSFAAIKQHIEEGVKSSEEMEEVFIAISKDIRLALVYSFSEANPNNWEAITAKYREWKTEHGYPETIGIMTGALKKSLTEDAVVETTKKSLLYTYNEEEINPRTEKTVGEYAIYFNNKREIMGFAESFIQEIIISSVQQEIDRGFNRNVRSS